MAIIKKVVLLLAILMGLCLGQDVFAQRKGKRLDTLIALKEFIQVNDVFHNAPLYMQVELIQRADYFIKKDSQVTQAEFYIGNTSSYLRFGQIEQIADSSLSLLINEDLKRMYLSFNAQVDRQNIKEMMAMIKKDSSVAAVAKKYSVRSSITSEEITNIELNNRSILSGSSLPVEQIKLEYNTKDKLPLRMRVVRRTLKDLDDESYQLLSKEANNESRLVIIDNKNFLIQEDQFDLLYKKIVVKSDRGLPVAITDRIIRDKNGEYIPAKNFEHYSITIQ